jgi:hypothetical protein
MLGLCILSLCFFQGRMSFIQPRVVILIKYCVILLIYVAELFITSIPLSDNMREHVMSENNEFVSNQHSLFGEYCMTQSIGWQNSTENRGGVGCDVCTALLYMRCTAPHVKKRSSKDSAVLAWTRTEKVLKWTPILLLC